MNTRLLFGVVVLLLAMTLLAQAQQSRTISYQGILKNNGALFTGEATFVFTLYSGDRAEWTSTQSTLHVIDGLFHTYLGPFPNGFQFDRIDSLGVTFNGAELSPRLPVGAVAFSFSASHAMVADSAKNPGPKGDKGNPGDLGPQGAQGLKGDKGDAGAQGAQGLKGDKGDKGDAGLKGDKGDPGVQGVQGTQGLKGDKGDAGTQGAQGLKGDKGDLGNLGPQGAQGLKGDKGDSGLKGDKGDPGVQGVQGSQGLKGDKGDLGDLGPQGAQGLKGDKGDAGAQGSQGLKGDKGDPGTQGVQGTQGLKGDKGDKGDVGPHGLNLVPIGSTDFSDGTTVVSLSTGSGLGTSSVTIARTGAAGSFRVTVSENAIDVCPYSAQWYVDTGGSLVLGASNDIATSLTPKIIDVGTSPKLSMLFRFGSRWAKLELFRQSSSDVNWYGFVSNN
ncbi:MAG: hypothetical protein WBD36_13705 [Bacteroidota bacterium]